MSKSTAILVAEFVGTFLLVGAVLMGANPAIALGILVLLIGGISGAHVNPAVSAGMASVNKIKSETMVKFWVVQLLGALLARIVYDYIKENDISLSMNFVALDGRLVVIEIIGAAVFLMGLTIAVTQKLDGIRLAVAVGGSLFLGLLFGGLVNPAVAFGFADINLSSVIGPLIGGLIGVQLGQMITDKKLK
jgi:glycerol uptake facilitator-like aquaporin